MLLSPLHLVRTLPSRTVRLLCHAYLEISVLAGLEGLDFGDTTAQNDGVVITDR